MRQVSITTEGIQRNLKKYKPIDALCEYIWNGFDAQADTVYLKLYTNEFGLINKISVSDNGTGIVYEELNNKFKPFNDSKKADNSKIVNHSLPHGRQGIGRLTFFVFAQMARWNTVYVRNGEKYEYYIEMEKDSLNQFDDNGGNEPKTTVKETGTEVIFTQLQEFSKDEIIEHIKNEFFWFLELNKNRGYKIYIDDGLLSYEDFVEKRVDFMPDIKLKHDYKISIVQWKQSLGKEFSKFYYLDSFGTENIKKQRNLIRNQTNFTIVFL